MEAVGRVWNWELAGYEAGLLIVTPRGTVYTEND